MSKWCCGSPQNSPFAALDHARSLDLFDQIKHAFSPCMVRGNYICHHDINTMLISVATVLWSIRSMNGKLERDPDKFFC
jgi:hypothetical protein